MNGVALHEARPVGGPVFTPGVRAFAALAALAGAAIIYRFAVGLGGATALNDGYPWGIWIVFDVVTGTALACGGYAVALLVYILNKGAYHPMVRPALLTSALGYSLAAISISVDVGRPWLLYRVPLWVNNWNLHSVLFEVALCVMAYVIVLWIEVSPAFLEKFAQGPDGFLKRTSDTLLPILNKALPFLIALGLLLPTMHQSSLGSLMLLAGKKLNGLWSTPFLPLYFLLSCIAMGFAAVVFESTLASLNFKRARDTRMLAGLAGAMRPILVALALIRIVDLAVRGRIGLMFTLDRHALLFWIEMALFLAPVVLLSSEKKRLDAGNLFRAAMLMMLAGTLFRFDTFLLAYHPGSWYSYFPSVAEIVITLGLVALEIVAYVFLVKTFPILGGAPSPAAAER